MISDQITFKLVEVKEADVLLNLSLNTFLTAFAHLNHPDDIAAYTAKAFTMDKMLSEMQTSDSEFYFALYENQIAGYMKLNFNTAQTESQSTNSMEIERIYVDASFQNKNIGSSMLNFAIDIAKFRQLKQVWLGVWEHNGSAIRFYERNGFKRFGSHNFMLGNDPQTDLLLKLEL